MPYRRSRLQDYYEQLLGGKPEEPESEEPKQDLPPYIYPSVPPRPQPAPPPIPQPQPESPHKYADQPVSPPPAQPTPPAEQSTGQASSSDSGKQQSGTGASQTDDSSDGDHGKDETGAQEVLPDFGEAQRDFGRERLVDGTSADRLYAFSNLEFLRVKQDMERRPLTFKRCFEQAGSPRSALEFIYATPPNLADDELRHLEQAAKEESDIRAGMTVGGAGDAHDTGFTNSRSILRYEEHLEDKYEFAIEWGEAANETNMAGQLNDLAKSVAHIVSYLDVVYADDPKTTGISVFQQYFSQNEHGQLNIQLGADALFVENFENITKEDAPYIGFVPLSGTNNMYLGSKVDIPTIVHEFGHVIDRSLSIEDKHHEAKGVVPVWIEWVEKTGLNLNADILQYGIVGFAGKQNLNEEIWADLFMTAVLDSVIGGPLYVYSSTYERIRQLSVSEFDHCEAQQGLEDCDRRPVKWVTAEDYNIRGYTVLPKDQFPILFRSLLRE